jgi:hypothetical protein
LFGYTRILREKVIILGLESFERRKFPFFLSRAFQTFREKPYCLLFLFSKRTFLEKFPDFFMREVKWIALFESAKKEE